LLTGVVGIYASVHSVSASDVDGPPPEPGPTPLETCTGNNALAQQGNSDAEQGTNQDQSSCTGAQAVSPESNALTGNSLDLQLQQNGECAPIIDQPPNGDRTSPSPYKIENEYTFSFFVRK
jgi:hypothetical protein